jgi:phenylalanyl-tRNA synthetase alpha chain
MAQSIPEQAQAVTAEAERRLSAATTVDEVKAIDTEFLGRGSALSNLKAGLRDLDQADRPTVGKSLGEARARVEALVAERTDLLSGQERASLLEAERLDLSEVLSLPPIGHHHPVSRTWRRLEDTFVGMGYTVAEGPEIETDWYNFGALNLPEAHPARSMWDTFYLEAGEPGTVLLRTHTSPVQIRTMLAQEPPIYIIAPGRAFRVDTPDATHLPVFHQIEGLVIDRGITFADLAGTVDTFVKALFGDDRTTRLRPSYFPFTEPSAEFDMSTADGGWIELGGCGMVHPNVLANCKLDPEEWSGFAFGFGIDRIAKEQHGIDDLREFVAGDVRFLSQF